MSSAYACIKKTTVTKNAAVVEEWIRDIRWLYCYKHTVVGLDTEWIRCPKDNNVNKGQYYRLALLQLCVDDNCLIFQICWKDYVPLSLQDFLADPNFTFVGVGIAGDLAMLRDEYDLHCTLSKDLAAVAKMKWPGKWRQTPGLKTLAREVAGIEIEKEKRITLSNWGLRYLSQKQIEYACLDAYVSYQIGVKLQSYF